LLSSRDLGIIAALVLLVPAASMVISTISVSTATATLISSALHPSGNATASVGARLTIVKIAGHHVDAYVDLPVAAESFELFGQQSFHWTFISRVGDRAGADLTVANFGTQTTLAVLTCDSQDSLEFAALETPGYGPGAVERVGANSYGMILPGGSSGNFTLILQGQSPGQYTVACTISEGN